MIAALALVASPVLGCGNPHPKPAPPPPTALLFTPSTAGAWDYGTVDAGTTVSQAFIVTTSDGKGAGKLAISLSGAAAFTKALDTCTKRELGPHRSCSVTIQYAPSTAGQQDIATLTAQGKKGITAASLELTGQAMSNAHYIFWTGGDSGTIGRAGLDGSNANAALVGGAAYPIGVAADAAHVYWTEYGRGTIGRADVDGTNVDHDFVIGLCAPNSLAVDASHIYWGSGCSPLDSIGRASLDGSNVEQTFITGISVPMGIAVDADHVYWVTQGTEVGRAGIDGSSPDYAFVTGGTWAMGVAVDSEHIYWANYGSNQIGRADLDGSNADPAFVYAIWPNNVAVDDEHIYWASGWAGGMVVRADLDGTNSMDLYYASPVLRVAVN